MLKSIVEEASSVAKALEKAWYNAGNPEEFSVKVFQLPTRNMFGFTTISAKVGIFFTARQQQASERGERRPRQQRERSGQRDQQRGVQRSPRQQHEPREQRVPCAQGARGYGDVWTEELTAAATEWLRGALGRLNMDERSFVASAQGGAFKVRFSNSMGRDEREERVVLSSFAHLLGEVLRNKFGQRALRNLKISVESAGGRAGSDERV